MTTIGSNPTASVPNYASDEPFPLSGSAVSMHGGYLGLPASAWVKCGILTVLMIALYRFNLARLWAKTNPFNGEGNWEHAFLVPLVGLYYLYVWREDLLSPAPAIVNGPGGLPPADRWTLPGIWLFIHSFLLLVILGVLWFAGGANSNLLVAVAAAPVVPIALGFVAFSGAAGGYVFFKRQELKYPAAQLWLTNVWHGLGAWFLAAFVVMGCGFFVGITVPSTQETLLNVLRVVTGVLVIGSAIAIPILGKSAALRRRYDGFLARSSGWFGTFVMIWGILFSLWGIWPGQNDFFKDIGMVVSLFGVVLLTTNWRVMRIAWFPVVFLFCSIPWPDQQYSQLALPLQNLAARVGVLVLQVVGVEAGQNGTKMWFRDNHNNVQVLDVETACAGLKALMTFVSLAAAIAFLSARMLWQKILLVALAVPVAIFCNTMRISGQGLLHRFAGEEWSKDFAHGFVGLIMLIPGFFMILALWWLLDHLFIEEVDAPPGDATAAGKLALASASSGAAAPAIIKPTVPALPKTVIKIPKRPAASAPAPAPAGAAASPTAMRVAPAAPAAATGPAPVKAAVAAARRPAAASPASPARQAAAVPARPLTARPATAGTTAAMPAAKPPAAKPIAAPQAGQTALPRAAPTAGSVGSPRPAPAGQIAGAPRPAVAAKPVTVAKVDAGKVAPAARPAVAAPRSAASAPAPAAGPQAAPQGQDKRS